MTTNSQRRKPDGIEKPPPPLAPPRHEPKVLVADDVLGQWCIGPFKTSGEAVEYWVREASYVSEEPELEKRNICNMTGERCSQLVDVNFLLDRTVDGIRPTMDCFLEERETNRVFRVALKEITELKSPVDIRAAWEIARSAITSEEEKRCR